MLTLSSAADLVLMSVIGISPTDVVGGFRAAHKAISALKNEDGARDQYQTYRRSRDEVRAAAEALADNAASSPITSAVGVQQCLDTFLKKQAREKQSLAKFETVLGVQLASSEEAWYIPEAEMGV